MTNYAWSISPNSGTITWQSGSNQATVFWNATGPQWISVSYTNTSRCTAAAPAAYNVTVNPIPATSVITQSGNILSSTAPAGNQWYFNRNVFQGATGQSFEAVYHGDYSIIVTLNGCNSAMSNTINVVVTGITDAVKAQKVEVFPNPNNGHFTLYLTTSSKQEFNLRIVNNLGIQVYERKNLVFDGNVKESINWPACRAVPGCTEFSENADHSKDDC